MKLTDIFLQASKDFASRPLHGKGYQAYIFLGFKIVKDNRSEIVIYLTQLKVETITPKYLTKTMNCSVSTDGEKLSYF